MTFTPETLPNLQGRTYTVTGGNAGIGYYTVANLAAHGAHVYMCSRSPQKGNAAISSIKKTHPSAKISLLQMDLSDLSSVVEAAKQFLSRETALHGLVNNAGIMATPFQLTKDGHEGQWQTNYLAHWVFTEHLLPLMLRTAETLPAGSVRIVNLTSSGHLGAPAEGINFADPSIKDKGPWARYGQSKLANILHTKTLHKKYGPGSSSARTSKGEIWVSCVHPGLVDTNLADGVDMNKAGKFLFVAMRYMGVYYTADKASWTSVYCVASPDMKPKESGEYMEIHKRLGEPKRLSASAKSEQLAERLEEWTRDTMGKEGWLK